MVSQTIDGISFQMQEKQDFSFLNRYGRVFCVFDQNDSGNISFGVRNESTRYFIKVAGAKTVNVSVSAEQAVQKLREAIPMYAELAHPHLVQLCEYFDDRKLCAAVFRWAEGDCLYDHWNFEMYAQTGLASPRQRFKGLSCEKKLKAFDAVFDFLAFAESKNYVAVDFYDGSILYGFRRDAVTICDIDLFRKCPAVNDMGEKFWGSTRLKAPEEYVLGADIDAATNVFTLGALLFHFFGNYTADEIKAINVKKAFFPCRPETWELPLSLHQTALKAVSPDRSHRYDSVKTFYEAWRIGLTNRAHR